MLDNGLQPGQFLSGAEGPEVVALHIAAAEGSSGPTLPPLHAATGSPKESNGVFKCNNSMSFSALHNTASYAMASVDACDDEPGFI